MGTRMMRAAAWSVLAACGAASADIVTRNAAGTADVGAMRASWLADCGVAGPTYTVDFETGFVDRQNVSAVPGLFPGGLVITDSSSAHSAAVRTGSSLGGSMPNGNFGLAHNEQPYLELSFPAPGVEGFSLADIDHTGTNIRVTHADGAVSTFSIETTGSVCRFLVS